MDRFLLSIVEFGQLVHLGQIFVGPLRFFFVNLTDGESYVNQNILAYTRIRYIRETCVSGYAAEVDPGHGHPKILMNGTDSAGNR